MKKLRYEVKGMSCAACVSHVELAAKRVVDKEDTVTVSLLTNSVTLEIKRDDRSEQEIQDLLSASLKKIGYSLLTDNGKAENPKDRATLRLILSFAFTLAVMYLSMGPMIGLALPSFLVGAENAVWMATAQLFLTVPVVILQRSFFQSGLRALWHRAPNMDSLIAVGSGASILYGLVSIVLILANVGNTDVLHQLVHDLYFESAAMILSLVALGKRLEAGAKAKASDAVRSLSKLSPKAATVEREEGEVMVAVEELRVGDILLIRAGESIPVDGEVVLGEGSADESALTGESMPVEKGVGDSVRAACILTAGFLKVRATRVGEDTSLSRIVHLLEDAAASKAPIARIADRVSRVFVPVVMSLSLLTLAVWMLASGSVESALRSAIAVLVISCPCALGLATPTAITVAIGRGAKGGILFCSAEALERLGGVRTLLLDKTGTVTEGHPTVTHVCSFGRTPLEVLSLAAAVERRAVHPLAEAIASCAEEMGAKRLESDSFTLCTGFGAEGEVMGRRIWVGKPTAESKEAWKTLTEASNFDFEGEEPLGVRMIPHEDERSAGADFLALEAMGRTAVAVTEEMFATEILKLFAD